MNAPLPKPRRRLQLSLRTLLALTALAAGVLGYGLFRVQQRARAIRALEQAGAQLAFRSPDWQIGRDPWWLVVPWTGVDRRGVSSLTFYGASIERVGLVRRFPEVQFLSVGADSRALTEPESANLAQLHAITNFGVFSARVSAPTIKALANAKRLVSVTLAACTVNDDVAEALGDLAQVKRMELVYTDIPAPAAARLRQRLPGIKLRIAPDP
ncbi:MAG: hypothetical protein U0836_20530 [Pirellulales bacterium]